jgi:YfiR/HmsC-like
MDPPSFTVGLITRGTIAILLLMGPWASAQDVTEPSLKAAFIYSFAKFTEWPADVPRTAEVCSATQPSAMRSSGWSRGVFDR